MNIEQKLNTGTFAPGVGDKKWWMYYTQMTVANDTVPVTLFQSALGTTGLTRLDQTNFPNNGSLPNSEKFEVHGLMLEYIGNAAKADADFIAVRKWLSTTALEMVIQQKWPILQAPLSRLMGLTLGLFNDPTTTAEPVSYTSRENAQAFYKLGQKVTIQANTNFRINIYPGVAAGANQTSDILKVTLVGDLFSAVG